MILKIRCDSCEFEASEQDHTTWWDKGCPVCGAKIFNMTDKILIRFICFLEKVGIVKSVKAGEKGSIRINTSRRK